jgi:hypothetical protein
MAARPTAPTGPTHPAQATHDPTYPPQLGTAGADEVADAPPSYEDAITDEIAPVESVARHYSGITDVNAPELVDSGSARLGDLMVSVRRHRLTRQVQQRVEVREKAEKGPRSKSCGEV